MDGNEDGTAPFLGALSDAADINRAVVTLTSNTDRSRRQQTPDDRSGVDATRGARTGDAQFADDWRRYGHVAATPRTPIVEKSRLFAPRRGTAPPRGSSCHPAPLP